MKKIIVILILLGSASCLASSDDIDLENCQWKTGLPLSPSTCEYLKSEEIRKKDENERMSQRIHAEIKAEALQAERREAQKKVDLEKAAERKAQEDAIKKSYQDELMREELQEEKELQAQMKVCGKDYNNPKVGMTLARARKCVGDFALSAQVNRQDGIVSIYKGQGLFIRVLNERIISWGYYR